MALPKGPKAIAKHQQFLFSLWFGILKFCPKIMYVALSPSKRPTYFLFANYGCFGFRTDKD